MTVLETLDALETAVAKRVGDVVFAVVEAVEFCPVCPWKAALAEQRKGVGVKREKHLENASRLREIGWGEMVNQQKGFER